MRSPTGAADAADARTVVVAAGESDAVLALAQLALVAAGWSVLDGGARSLPRVTTWRGERVPPPVPAVVVLGSQLAAVWVAARWIARGIPVGLIDPVDLDVLGNGVEAVRQSSAFVSPRVLGRFAELPELDARQVRLLELLGYDLRGRALRDRAATSESSLKRELARLRDLLGAGSNASLRSFARHHGFARANAADWSNI